MSVMVMLLAVYWVVCGTIALALGVVFGHSDNLGPWGVGGVVVGTIVLLAALDDD